MRTTIDIPDVLYRAVKSRAAAEGTTLRHITVALYGDWMQRPDWRPRIKTECVLTEAQPKPKRRLSCFGIVKLDPNRTFSHDWKDIQGSIAEGWAAEVAEKERRIAAQ